MTAKGRSLQVLTIAALLFAVTAKTGLAQQTSTPTNHPPNSASAEPPGARERAAKILSLISVWASTPISFYGKVLDGEGNPIEGAKADIVPWQSLTGLVQHNEKTTDAKGLFSITGIHGMRLNVTVSKEGYYQPPQASQIIGYVKGLDNYNPRPNPNDPEVFVLRKKGITEPLIMHSFYQSEIAKDGTPTNLDLQTGKETVGADAVQIQIWTKDAGVPKNGHHPYPWKACISVLGGGMQPRTGDGYNFQAPSSGYLSEEVIDMLPNDPKWSSQITKEYWFHFADGKYARATIGFFIGGFQFVNATSYLNPQPGHTNLEYDTNQATATISSVHP